MTELYIFSQDDEPLTIITEDTGLVSAPVRIEVNSVPDTPFSFTVEADSEDAKYVKDENKVVYRDHEGDLRLVVIKELDDSDTLDGPLTTATCEPEFMELAETFVLDRRFTDRTAQFALDAALENTGWIGEVEVELGLASTNFYRMRVVDAILEIVKNWGGEFKDIVEFDENNSIVTRKIKLLQRLGTDTGQRLEVDHNITEIGRKVLSYPVTAMYGWGASLETNDGGHTRYIDFADVVWSKANGDPVDKPAGQMWVGDPEAFEKYKRFRGGKWINRFGEFSNQDYEDPEELLWATWQNLQENKYPEVNYRLSVDLFDDKVSLGDTAIAIDRYFSRPIEIQARIIAMEYDLLDIEGTMIVEMGQFLNLEDNRLDQLEEKVDKVASRPQKVTENSYPDRKPSRPINVEAHGGREIIQLYWTYADELFIKHYEVYGSQVADFVPDTQHLLWRGQVSAFAHAVNTDETWYYYVRAVNYHGTPSDWSAKVSASTTRIMTEDIMWSEELAERMRELHRVSDIIGENGVDFNQISAEAKELLNQQAKIYTDEEIEAESQRLLTEIANKHDSVIQYVDGELRAKVDWSEYDLFKGDYSETVTTINDTMDTFNRRIQETNVRVDNLDIRGTNFVTHLPSNWEEGYYAFADGARVNPGSGGLADRAVRLIEKYSLEGNTDYTLTRYLDVQWVAIYLYDENNNFLRVRHVGYSDTLESLTFRTASNETKATISMAASYNITSLNVGVDLRVKLSLGTETSGWTPNIDDTGQLVANVQTYVSEWEQTSQLLRSDLSLLEMRVENDVITQLSAHDTAIKQNVTDIGLRAETNYVDSIAGSLENSIAALNVRADGIITTVENIRIGGRNLIPNSRGDNLEGWRGWNNTDLSILDGSIRVRASTSPSSYGAVTPKFEVEAGKQYTLSLNIASNFRTSILDYVYILYDAYSNQRVNSIVMTAQHADLRRYSITFTANNTGTASMLLGAYVKETDFLSEGFLLEKVQLENGNIDTPWQPSVDDLDQRMTKSESEISQLSDDITLKVDVDSIVSEINLNREGIRFSGNLLHLNGLSLIDEAIIQTAHIANGAIEKAKLGTAIIDDAHIDEITGRVIVSKTITVDHLSVAELSGISANLGQVTAGVLRSNNNTFEFNLNTANVDFYQSAAIRFNDTGGGVRRNRSGQSSFITFPVSLDTDYPMVAIGTDLTTGSINVNNNDFRGIRIHPRNSDQYNNAVGSHFAFTENVNTLSTGGIVIKPGWDGSLRGIYPVNTGNYGYDLGAVINRWSNIYVDNVRAPIVHIRNPVGTGGYLFETQANSGSTIMTFRGINGGSWSYYLGASGSNAWSFGYINHLRPSGSSHSVGASGNPYNYVYTSSLVEGSDISLKDNINESNLGLDFINDLRIVDFRMVDTGQYKSGVIAQELEATLINHGVDIDRQSMVFTHDEVMGVAYTQLVVPGIKGLQELSQKHDLLDQKLDEEITWLKVENQLQANEIKILKNKVEKLEELVA